MLVMLLMMLAVWQISRQLPVGERLGETYSSFTEALRLLHKKLWVCLGLNRNVDRLWLAESRDLTFTSTLWLA